MGSNEDLTSGIENLDVNKEFCHDILEELVQVLKAGNKNIYHVKVRGRGNFDIVSKQEYYPVYKTNKGKQVKCRSNDHFFNFISCRNKLSSKVNKELSAELTQDHAKEVKTLNKEEDLISALAFIHVKDLSLEPIEYKNDEHETRVELFQTIRERDQWIQEMVRKYDLPINGQDVAKEEDWKEMQKRTIAKLWMCAYTPMHSIQDRQPSGV